MKKLKNVFLLFAAAVLLSASVSCKNDDDDDDDDATYTFVAKDGGYGTYDQYYVATQSYGEGMHFALMASSSSKEWYFGAEAENNGGVAVWLKGTFTSKTSGSDTIITLNKTHYHADDNSWKESKKPNWKTITVSSSNTFTITFDGTELSDLGW